VSDLFINYKVSRENQRFYLNHQEIAGLQSIQPEINASYGPILHLGLERTSTMLRGQSLGRLTTQSFLVNSDQFIGFTGANPATGHLVFVENAEAAGDGLIFNPLYLTSYNLKYTDNQIPEITTSFNGYETFGQMVESERTELASASLTPANYSFLIPNRGSITITLDDLTNNRLISFDLNLEVPRTPIYIMGQLAPLRVDSTPPITVSFSAQMELGRYTFKTLLNILNTKTVKEFTITCNDYRTDQLIKTYTFGNLELINYSFTSSINDNIILSLQLRGFVDF